MPDPNRSVLALDVGSKRVGVAVASMLAQIPHPLVTLTASGEVLIAELKQIVKEENVERFVIGLPRGLNGQETGQTKDTRDFKDFLSSHFTLPIDFQDEALTSKKAEQELDKRGKPYKAEDIDSLAATYILEDWLNEHRGKL
ncbi:MAG: Holliday junction resolvase RuvX [Candidatus Saccharimonadales bacterium]